MNLAFSVDHGSIEIYQSLPKNLAHLAIRGAHTIYLRTDFANACFHCFVGDGYRAWLNKIHSFGNGYIHSRGNFCVIEFSCAMVGQLEGTWDGISNAGLRPLMFNIRSTPHVLTAARFRKGRTYQTFEIEFEWKFIQKLAKHCPQFNYFLDLVQKGEPTKLNENGFACPPNMRRAIRDFLHNSYHAVLQPMLLERCITEILVEAFQLAFFNMTPDRGLLQIHEEDQLYKARTLILEQAVDETFCIAELCRKLKMSEEKLFNGFRALFGKSPGKFKMECKFLQIEQWLLEGISPSAVSNLAGYGSVPTFYQAFGKIYNCTPTEWQRERGVEIKK